LQGSPHPHGGAIVFQNGGILGEDSHAGANASLGEVYGGNVALLEHFKCFGEFAFKFGEELTTGNFGSVGGAGAADEDDRGGEGIIVSSDISCTYTLNG